MGTSVRLETLAHTIKLDSEDARFHQESVADILGRQTTNFPGAQPVSFARKHLYELQRADYFVAEKTDGIRCLLYLTQLHNQAQSADNPAPFIEAQFLIDRKNDYYYIEPGYLHIPPPSQDPAKKFQIEAWHIKTILDGELVRQRFPNGKEQLTYVIFDALASDGQSLITRNLNSRLGKAETLVYQPWKAYAQAWPEEAKVQPFQISMKRPELGYGMLKMFKETIPQLPHVNDGLIFTCRTTGYQPGTDQHILKWKPPHENTIDFRLQLGKFPMEEDDDGAYEDFDQKPQMDLLIFHGRGKTPYEKFADLHVTDNEWEAMKSMNQQLDWRIIECWRDAGTGQWRPKLDDGLPRFRDDKDHANHISTVESVLESIEDAVTEDDLINFAPAIKDAWKAREMREKEEREREQERRKQQHEAAKAQHMQRQQAQQPAEVKAEVKEEDNGPGYTD